VSKIFIDSKSTLGDLFYIGCDQVFEWENGKRTDKVGGYRYKLASSVFGEQVEVKVDGPKREFQMMQKVELERASVRGFVKKGSSFVEYAFSADDIKVAD
jgi:hypothetical protein